MSHLRRVIEQVARETWGTVDDDGVRAIIIDAIHDSLAGVDDRTDRAALGAIVDHLAARMQPRTGIPVLTIIQIIVALVRIWLSLTEDEKNQIFDELDRETQPPPTTEDGE